MTFHRSKVTNCMCGAHLPHDIALRHDGLDEVIAPHVPVEQVRRKLVLALYVHQQPLAGLLRVLTRLLAQGSGAHAQ